MNESAVLALSDGSIFFGRSIGVSGSTVGEIVFNTSMTGYQEILTDSSYLKQIVTLTYPHIGNVGINKVDIESTGPKVSGLIVRDYPSHYSNWRSEGSLSDYLKSNNVVAISDIDTRRLTRLIREKGALGGCISSVDLEPKSLIKKAVDVPSLTGQDLASLASTNEIYRWEESPLSLAGEEISNLSKKYTVVVYDYGIKFNILRLLVERECSVIVVPAKTKPSVALSYNPDGIFFSNGPGDPEPCEYAIDAIQEFSKLKIPLFGICLGYQLIALAFGGRTKKMKFGHHGANHPVKELHSGKVLITSQNHGFVVEEETLPPALRVTHRSNFDGSLQGYKHESLPVIGFQGHPEASPGPHDLKSLFDEFVGLFGGAR